MLFSSFQFAELPGGFHAQFTGGAMGQQAQAPAIHHLVDDLDIDRGIGLIRVHALKANGLGLQKARIRAESVFWLEKAYFLLSLEA